MLLSDEHLDAHLDARGHFLVPTARHSVPQRQHRGLKASVTLLENKYEDGNQLVPMMSQTLIFLITDRLSQSKS